MTNDGWTKVDAQVAMEVASHEAIILQTYVDSVGVNTWSVGLTSNTGHMVDRYIGKPSTMQHALNVYVWALDRYAHTVRETFKGTPLTKEQFTAALSFHWNTGKIATASWVRKFKAGDMQAARTAFMAYNKPKAIIPRRKKEAELLFEAKWNGDGKITEYTRLTKKRAPVWSSARRVDISAELAKAFRVNVVGEEDERPFIKIDHLSRLDAAVDPTHALPPVTEEQLAEFEAEGYTLLSRLFQAVKSWFKSKE